MASPTLSLCLIVKNEEKNLNRLLDSVEGCMDEIVLIDTGSTDKTVEIAKERGCEVYHFEWVDSFCKARNFAFSKATKDYIIWLDGDDVLSSKEYFKQWKETSMGHAQAWFNTYNYAMNQDGKPVISFLRERVFKREINPVWQYDLHEGVIINPAWVVDYALSWTVNHLRDAEDVKSDRNRNLKIIEKMRDQAGLDPRMQFYYGKELFETGEYHRSLPEFEKAILAEKLELHDRILAIQYSGYACQCIADMLKDDMKEEKIKWCRKVIDHALDGLKLDPSRAEFSVLAADTCVKMGSLHAALPFYAMAKNSINPQIQGSKMAAPIYQFKECYGELPSLQMAKIMMNMGRVDEALQEASECVEKYHNKEAMQLLEQLRIMKPLVTLDNNQEPTDEVIFSCPPNQAYPFDEVLYQSKGMGGSETALIEMARLIKSKTNIPVKVFNTREEDVVAPSGVEYISNRKLNEYLSKKKPKMHIAWRHNIRVTKAPTYLWCHDLFTPTVEQVCNFEKIMCLSDFHKNYVMGKQGVPEDRIWVTRNGIVPEKLKFERKPKNPNKIVWMSSPDRGLDRCMIVCDEILKEHPEIELHVYYGIENLKNYGPQMSSLADRLKEMMSQRPYVKYHGFTEQSQMYKEVSDAVLWLHPCNFIETYCITALEMLALGVFPVTRRLGALANTLKEAEDKNQAILLDHDCISENEIKAYADAAKMVLKGRLWENVGLDLEKNSWESVADAWINEMQLLGPLKTEEIQVV